MASPITEINFTDYTEGIPAFFAMVVMPFSYSIADGIGFGVISYTVLKLLGNTEERKKVNPMLIIVSILFIIKFVIG
jgi:AGZA family xanthine/uracil permease-like MFS transporter